MFSLKGTVLKAFGLSEKEDETDVEAWSRIQEAMDAEKTKASETALQVEKNFADSVSAINTRLDELTQQNVNLTKQLETIEANNKKALDEVKSQFAAGIATIKAGNDSITTEGEQTKTTGSSKEPGTKVPAWPKQNVSIRQLS